MSNIVFLSLGSNLGDRESNLVKALQMISATEGFETIACSPIYISQPEEMDKSAPSFLNMVIKGQFDYTPLELLTNLENIEKKLGRNSKGDLRPRPIDIDILLFGDQVIEAKRLSIPHRKMTSRAFVLVPLLQIEPELVDPATGKRFATYLKDEDVNSLVLYKEVNRHHVRT